MSGKQDTKYWICVTTKENWDVIKNRQVWGVTDRHQNVLAKTEVGDLLVFYVISKQVGGIFRVETEPTRDSKYVFKGGTFPNRIKISPVLVPKSPVEFSEKLRSNLEFIKNKQRWSAYFRRAMLLISEKDFQFIENELGSNL